MKLRHFLQLTPVGVWEAQDIVFCDEVLQFVDSSPGISEEVCGFAVFPADRIKHPGDRLMASGCVIGRKGRPGVISAPELPGSDVHLTRDTMEFVLGAGEDLVGGNVAIGGELQFAIELLLAQSPFTSRPGAEVGFKELLVGTQVNEQVVGNLFQLRALRGIPRQFVDALLVKTDHPSVLVNTRLKDRQGRVGQGASGLGDYFRELPDSCDDIGDVFLVWKARLGEQAVDTATQVVVVASGILLECRNILSQPALLLEMVAKDL